MQSSARVLEAKWIEEYQKLGALWIHDDNPARPHAELTSGKHSNGFFNSGLVMQHPLLVREAANDLARVLFETDLDAIKRINRVIGPAMGAITLAHELACAVGTYRKNSCLTGFAEKVTNPETGVTELKLNRIDIKPGERVLVVEDVSTTGDSALEVVRAVEAAGGVVLPYIAVLVNRSGKTEIGGRKFVALINREMPVWKPDVCPLCKRGSAALRPKDKENWAALNATYN